MLTLDIKCNPKVVSPHSSISPLMSFGQFKEYATSSTSLLLSPALRPIKTNREILKYTVSLKSTCVRICSKRHDNSTLNQWSRKSQETLFAHPCIIWLIPCSHIHSLSANQANQRQSCSGLVLSHFQKHWSNLSALRKKTRVRSEEWTFSCKPH